MRSTARRFVALVAFSLSAGCGDVGLGPSRQAELESNRRLWASFGLTSYQLTLKADCFCAVNGPVRLTVVNDSIVSAKLISTGEAVNPAWFLTINSLFAFIDRGFANHAAVLRVTYDPSFGYPVQIIYVGAINAADDGVTYTVSQFDRPAVTELRPQLQPAAGQRQQ